MSHLSIDLQSNFSSFFTVTSKSDSLQNFHDCTAHIRRKHEISHAQAGRYVEKLDTDVPLPPSAVGHYKIRVKVKSLPPLVSSTTTDEPPLDTSQGLSSLLVDDIQEFGEEMPSPNEEMMIIEEDNDDDDDDDDDA